MIKIPPDVKKMFKNINSHVPVHFGECACIKLSGYEYVRAFMINQHKRLFNFSGMCSLLFRAIPFKMGREVEEKT